MNLRLRYQFFTIRDSMVLHHVKKTLNIIVSMPYKLCLKSDLFHVVLSHIHAAIDM